MRSISAMVLCVLSARALMAQSDSPEAEIRRLREAMGLDKACNVEGAVTDAASGKPLRETIVELTLQSPDSKPSGMTSSGLTKDNGQYLVPAGPGVYLLTAKREGYIDTPYGAKAPDLPGVKILLEPNCHKTGLDIRMIPLGTVSGLVRDEDGQPIEGAAITVLGPIYINGVRQYRTRGAGFTDDRGRYRVTGLQPGKYFVMARPDPPPPQLDGLPPVDLSPNASEERYLPSLYPGSTDLRSAVSVNVRAGAKVEGIDIRPVKGHFAGISGRVIDQTGFSTHIIGVTLLPRAGATVGLRREFRTQPPDQRFEFRDVPPGDYSLVAEVQIDGGRHGFQARQIVSVGSEPLKNVVLTVSKGIDIPGVLRVEAPEGTKDPLNGAHLTSLLVRLPVADLEMMTIGYPPKGEVNENGKFVVESVSPERHVFNVLNMPPDYYMKSMHSGGADLIEDVLDVSSGAVGPLEFVLKRGAGRISGIVKANDDQPLAGVTVALVPESEALRKLVRFFKSTKTEQTGAFALSNVRPGDYRVFAWEHVEDGAWQDPAFMTPIWSSGVKISLAEGGSSNVDLKAIPAEDR